MTEAKLINHNGSPAISINGEIFPPMMATVRIYDHIRFSLDEDYYRALGESGIRIFFVICDTEWSRPGAFEEFRREAEIILKAVPDAYLFPRVGLHPPVEWCLENPDELVKYSDGSIRKADLYTESMRRELPGMYSLCSRKWRRDAAVALEDTVRAIEALPYADRIAGYFVTAGGTSEWYYINPLTYGEKIDYLDTGGFEQSSERPDENIYGDVSLCAQTNFSEYLKEKYKTVDALRKAWGDPCATFDGAKIPDFDERYIINGVDYDLSHTGRLYTSAGMPPPPKNGTNRGCFLDLEHYTRVFDYYNALHLGTADSVIHFGGVIKKLCPNKLTGSFYGAQGAVKYFEFGQIAGTRKILESDAIDFLASPCVYENRQPSGFAGQRQCHDSFRIHGKMFIVEEDARTHREREFFKNYFETYTPEDSLAVLKRDFGRNLSCDLQAWWFDQLVGVHRYDDEQIYNLFKRQQLLAKEGYNADRSQFGEIAFIYDEESFLTVSAETSHQMVELFRNYEIDLIGAPAARFYHNDIENIPDFKLYVFVNCFYLTDSERAAIHRKLKRNHATALFLYGNGFINPDSEKIMSADNITDLTGVAMTEVDAVRCGKLKVNGKGFTASLDRGEIYGDFKRKMWANAASFMNRIKTSRVSLYPAFYPEDGDAETVARFLDCERPAVVTKECDGFTSVVASTKYLSSDFIRAVAESAGCHIYCHSDDVLYAGRGFVTIHATESGEKTIYFPEKCTVTDAYCDEPLGESVTHININMLKGETVTLRVTY